MCFSPEVSFSLAGVLVAGGAYCAQKAIRVDRHLVPLAVIPLVFGVQQFCEGWVWTGIEHSAPGVISVAAAVYLFFALCFWPIWIPFSMLLVERSGKTRLYLRLMLALGVATGVGLMIPIVVDPTSLAVDVTHHSLYYNIDDSPVFRLIPNALWQAIYFAVVSTPLFVSSLRKMVHFGVAVILSAAATHVFFDHTFASVWCFFAAALSLYLCVLFFRIPTRLVIPRPAPL